MIVPKKKIGQEKPELRVCVNYKKLNKFLADPSYKAHNIEGFREYFEKCLWFTCLDFRDAFTQIPLHPESQPFTAFGYRQSVYCFTRVCFGMSSSMQAFIMAVGELFKDLPFVMQYIDDVIIASQTEEEHLEHVEKALTILDASGLTLNLRKCEFFKGELTFLGYRIDEVGICPDVEKVAALVDAEPPDT